jgi:hypothetical protein
VAELGDAVADDGIDAKFLVEFADEGLLGGLAKLNLTSGELPFEAHGLVWAALTDEDFGASAVLAGGRSQDQRRGHQPKRLAACVALSIQSTNALFHAGVCLSYIVRSALMRLNYFSLDAFRGRWRQKLQEAATASSGSV